MNLSYQKGATIAALATPPGEGAIAIIRISGPEALAVAGRMFSRPVHRLPSHQAVYGRIVDAGGATLDQVLLIVMKAPRSYTGEETVEIHCHGGSLIARRVLQRTFEEGARPAAPGEFTFQAVLNGKLDLAQAEAVQQLIASRNEWAHQSATQQLEGALSRTISRFQKELTDAAAILEAWVDFPEEGLEFTTLEEMGATLKEILQRMRRLLSTFHEGKTIHEGLSLCLLGSPNVGKSSLMNALLGKERAIVTELAGTTRDLLEDEIHLCGLHFRLIDTAGIRETEERIEQEGIRRSRAAMEQADLLLLLLDASRPLSPSDRELLQLAPREKTILVWNKIDLATPSEAIAWHPIVSLSAKEGMGFDDLRRAIDAMIWKEAPPSKEEVMITNLRHHHALSCAIGFCETVIAGLEQGASPEFVAFDLRQCLSALGSIIGTNVSEDILSSIFSQFCLGK